MYPQKGKKYIPPFNLARPPSVRDVVNYNKAMLWHVMKSPRTALETAQGLIPKMKLIIEQSLLALLMDVGVQAVYNS